MNLRQVQTGSLTLACLWMALALVGVNYCVAHAQEETGEESYHYDPREKRDPFLSPYYHQHEQARPEEAKTPLQRFDLGQLKLVGIVLEEKEPKALIEDSSGLGYIVTKGTPIGSKGGIVKAIEPKRVVVEEYETDFYGKRQAQERELLFFVGGSTPEGEAKKTR
jgi:Tfp pilus assembly protein PilP